MRRLGATPKPGQRHFRNSSIKVITSQIRSPQVQPPCGTRERLLLRQGDRRWHRPWLLKFDLRRSANSTALANRSAHRPRSADQENLRIGQNGFEIRTDSCAGRPASPLITRPIRRTCQHVGAMIAPVCAAQGQRIPLAWATERRTPMVAGATDVQSPRGERQRRCCRAGPSR